MGGLADDLRGRSDEELGALFASRPDLLVPVPPDVETLAMRALSRWSVTEALEELDLWCGEIAQALVALGSPTSYAAVAGALGVPAEDAARGLDRLHVSALTWGDQETVHVADAVAGLLNPRIAFPAHPQPPRPACRPVDQEVVDRTAGAAAATVVQRIEDLLEAWGETAPVALRAGGIGVRELRRTATLLDVPEPVAVLLLETAYAAGLLSVTAAYDAEWLPTPAYDEWRAQPVALRWAALADAWLRSPRATGRGRDDQRKPAAPLGPDRAAPHEPGRRMAALDALGAVPPGQLAPAGDVVATLRWRRPLRCNTAAAAEALEQAEAFGCTGGGGLATAARALLESGPAAAAAAVDRHLPPPLDSFLLQADLTAVAPGRLEPALARELRLLADVESTGGATVYRFGEASLRRGFDAGRPAADVHAFLATRSRTPVPQPLTYLVDDVARRHGGIRVGEAGAFLRCDDETLLEEVLAHRRTAPLRLRRIAPTVLVGQEPVATTLDLLRAAGFAPAHESADGQLVLERAGTRRTTRLPAPAQRPARAPELRPELVAAAVRAVRAGERAARHVPSRAAGTPAGSPIETLRLLQQAALEGRVVWIGYVNASGVASRRFIEPISVLGGVVTAYDHRHEEKRTFAVHRITGIALVEENEA